MSAASLLLVDDEAQLVRVLRSGLEAGGYQVDAAGDAREALRQASSKPYNAIILDLGLPDSDGKEVIASLRRYSNVPIIVLSARDAEQEKIDALDLGADDFVSKPFKIGELMARLRASMRTRAAARASETVNVGPLRIDFSARRATISGYDIKPSPRELKLLRVFVEHLGSVLTYRQIAVAVWGEDAEVEAQFVRVLIGNLRHKMELGLDAPRLILTEPGIGYRMRRCEE